MTTLTVNVVGADTYTDLPRLRRLPVPVNEPRPASRIVHDRASTPPGQAAFSFTLPVPVGLPDELPMVTGDDDTFDARRPTPSRALPEPRRWAGQFVQAAVEVCAGLRPASQLVRWVSDDVLATLSRRGALAGRRDARSSPRRAIVRTVRVCQPRDDAVEACAVVADRDRVRAVALRLEGLDGRWRVTAFQIG